MAYLGEEIKKLGFGLIDVYKRQVVSVGALLDACSLEA